MGMGEEPNHTTARNPGAALNKSTEYTEHTVKEPDDPSDRHKRREKITTLILYIQIHH
jgi:hypothetical protein